MKRLIFTLFLSAIFSVVNAHSYSCNNDPIEIPEQTVDPENPGDTGDPNDPSNPGDPNNPTPDPSIPVFIPITPDPDPAPGTPDITPLSYTLPDIDAYYFAGVLTITTNVDLGFADIYVTNLANGNEWADSLNGIGASVLTVGYGRGYYLIEVYTDNGNYSGSFTL